MIVHRNKDMRFKLGSNEAKVFLLPGKKMPIEVNVIFNIDSGLAINICEGHDNEPYEDPNAYNIQFNNILGAAINWAENWTHVSARISIANYLRYMAIQLESEDAAIQKSKAVKA